MVPDYLTVWFLLGKLGFGLLLARYTYILGMGPSQVNKDAYTA